MSDLFTRLEEENKTSARPLAYRMRPRSLDEYLGQSHLLDEGNILQRMIAAKRLGSIILYGPPGTGKTTLAHLLAQATSARFRQLSAVLSGVKEVRATLEEARDRLATSGQQTLLFIDEIHRFNKSQQDALLPDVEDGTVVLVGATTSNPFFAVNDALVSRSRVLQLEPLEPEAIAKLLRNAIVDKERGLGNLPLDWQEDALQWLAEVCDGDARQALTILELAVLSSDQMSHTPPQPLTIDLDLLRRAAHQKSIRYDPSGDEHYDLISALIKSMRGSDADAAIYWLARMLAGGEEIRFLCRRLVIFASEDIGNADPQALPLAVATMQACEMIGLPECQLNLAQTVSYLSLAPKSNASTEAIGTAQKEVREGRVIPVPTHLRDGHYAGSKSLGHGIGYQYPHDSDSGIVPQEYLGVDRQYYHPVDRGFEKELQRRIDEIRQHLSQAR